MKSEWRVTTLGDICDVDKVQGNHKHLPYVGLEHIESHTGRFIGTTEPLAVKSSTVRFSREHLLYGRLRPYLNKVMTPNFDGHCSTEIFPLKPKAGLTREFLCYWFLRDATVAMIDDTSTGARMPRANMNAVLRFAFSLPPLPEQRRIVGILDEAFDGIATAKANAEKNLQNARALFESHLNAVFTQRGDGETRLADLCEFSSGGTPSKENKSYWNGSIPWVSGRDMKSTHLSDTALHISEKAIDESSTRMAPAGSLLTLVRGMGLAHGAQIAELLVPCAFNQDIRAIHPNADVVPRYLLFALRTRINSSDNVMSNAAHGTMKIDMDELKSVRVPVPSVQRQREIVRRIDSLRDETQRLESLYQRKLAALDELKKSLLHQAFNGQL